MVPCNGPRFHSQEKLHTDHHWRWMNEDMIKQYEIFLSGFRKFNLKQINIICGLFKMCWRILSLNFQFAVIVHQSKTQNTFSFRMSTSRISIRDGSAVGRFYGAAARNGQAIPEKDVVTRESKEEGGCSRWLRKMCPCCCRRPSNSYNVTYGLDTAVTDEEKVTRQPDPPQPHTEDNELESETDNFHTSLPII